MSKPRYIWWGYVKGMVRIYPVLRQRKADMQAPRITVTYGGQPHGSGISNPTQAAALRQLRQNDERDISAVECAIADTLRLRDGAERMKIIELVYWRRTHTLEGAAQTIPCSIATAWRWHGDFIRQVAVHRGLMD